MHLLLLFFDFSVSGINEDGIWSPPITVPILLCTGCSKHGVCIDEVREDSQEHQYYQKFKCQCDAQYEGICVVCNVIDALIKMNDYLTRRTNLKSFK